MWFGKIIYTKYQNSVYVIGLWNIGAVTAYYLAYLGIETIAFDYDHYLIKNFNKYINPIFGPKLSEFIKNWLRSQT